MSPMFNGLGFSVYLSTFEAQKEALETLCGKGCYVFTSFHVSEEFDETYPARAKAMCRWLTAHGARIVADISKKTLGFFGVPDISQFARDMEISVLRVDYGFTDDEIVALSADIPIALNASTISDSLAQRLYASTGTVYGMHNFYPRPETGLDSGLFTRCNDQLRNAGIGVLAFLAGDMTLRGPIFEGLPTLEAHRKIPPYVSYLELVKTYAVDGVFVGDGIISAEQLDLIERYRRDSVIPIPVILSEKQESLYHKEFTVRVDSPACAMRLQESREYSCIGPAIQPSHCLERPRGCITMDNLRYSRYSGEIQIIRTPLAPDERVNVIGCVDDAYLALIGCIQNGDRILFIPVTSS